LALFSLAFMPVFSASANTDIGPLGANSNPVTPTLLYPQNSSEINTSAPTLSGLTLNGTDVEVFIDGVYSGKAYVQEGPAGTANFTYNPAQFLADGVHNAFTRAINTQNFNLKSDFSPLVTFNVATCPAPVLLEPKGIIYNNTPTLKGTAPSDSLAQVYIDDKVIGTARTGSNTSGTVEFTFTAPVLAEGSHTAYALTLQPISKVSEKSNRLEFEIAKSIEAALSAPTLLEPKGDKLVVLPKPIIKGVAHNKQVVDIYVDGKLSGTIKAGTHVSGVAGFTYRPFPDLNPGLHVINAQARNSQGKVSQKSNALVFQTGQYYPAPIVINTSKEIINPNETVVAGVVKSNSMVKVYVDNKLNGEIKAVNHPSGTASFTYKLSQAVGQGTHTLYAVALDEKGKESKTSNSIAFDYKPVIMVAKAETKKEIAKNTASSADKGNEVTVQSEESKGEIVAKNEEAKGEVVAKSGEDKGEVVVKTEDGTVSSSATDNKAKINTEVAVQTQNQQDKAQSKSIGLIVLVAVVILLIVWFFWVNKDYFIRKMKGIEAPTEEEVETEVETIEIDDQAE